MDWDWTVYNAIAEEWQMNSVFYHVISFCKCLFDTPIPNNIMDFFLPSSIERWQVKKLISPKYLLNNKATLGKQFPTLVKFFLFDNYRIKFKVMNNLLLPKRIWIKNDSKYMSYIHHLLHIIQVIYRGD